MCNLKKVDCGNMPSSSWKIGAEKVTMNQSDQSCIIGSHPCESVFGSTGLCFVGRPADEEFQLEEDILRQILQERNYETYVALGRVDPGKFAFCTKICSKIITSKFCIVILNQSKHAVSPDIRIPNPNVHLEYGMMLAFRKHVIPMQREDELLPFNIYPLDTIKYSHGNFKQKVEQAIDEVLMRLSSKEPVGADTPLQFIRCLSFRGMRFADVSNSPNNLLYQLGQPFQFNLFYGQLHYEFVGYFKDLDPTEILVNVKHLMHSLDDLRQNALKMASSAAPEEVEGLLKLLGDIKILVVVPDNAPKDKMKDKIAEFQGAASVPIELIQQEEIDRTIRREQDSVKF